MSENAKLVWVALRHPRRTLGLLLLLAALEGMFGSPEGAQRLLTRAIHRTYILAFVIAASALIFLLVHIRWVS